jgi:uncharacterized membrane protein YkoI
MKNRFCAALLLAALALSIFTGCSVNALQQLDAAEDAIDRRLDAVENHIENRIESAFTEAAVPMAPEPAAQADSSQPVLLTKEEAEKIALDHAGLSPDQVQRLRTKLDYERGKPEYEVDFRVDRWEYDYDIDAQTGEIRSWDKDWDD